MLTTALFALTAAVAPQEPGRPATVPAVIPIDHLLQPAPTLATPPWGTLLLRPMVGSRDEDVVLQLTSDEGKNDLGPDAIVDVIREREAEATDSGELYVDEEGGSLLLIGPKDAVARVQRQVDDIARIVTRPLELEFAVWDLARGESAPAGVLDAEGFARFVRDRKPRHHARALSRPGRPVGFERVRWQRYVHSSPVEVAQKTARARPETRHFADGAHAVARTEPLLGGDEFAVYLRFAVGGPRSATLPQIQTGIKGHPALDAPELASNFGLCSGRVQNGGALAVSLLGDPTTGDNLVVTLRVHSRVPPARLDDPDVALLPVGALDSSALLARAEFPLPDRDLDELDFDQRDRGAHITPDRLFDMVNGVFEAQPDAPSYSVVPFGSYLLLTGSRDAIAQVAQLLQTLQEQLVQNVEIEHVALLPDAAANRGAHLHQLRLPTLQGREATAVRLLETNSITNLYLEVASDSDILVPSLRTLQSGTWLRAAARAVGDGLYGDFAVQTTVAPPPVVDNIMPRGGALSRERADLVRVHHDGLVPVGQAIDHGDGPALELGGTAWRTRMTTTLRR